MNRPPADTPPDDWSGDDADTARETALPVWSGLDLSDGASAPVLPEDLKIGAEVIGNFVKTLPGRPGVYRMFDAQGGVLYIGKARNLKARVAAYARGQAHTNRVARMIAETAAMEFITTATEMEALLLEANLIKQLRPRYNVLLRDDKSFPYILVSGDHAAPQLGKHRGARTRKGDYYGPFAGVGAVNRTVSALQRAFLIRTCSDSYFDNRTRPCLLFQIKRCAGPCTGEITPQDYAELVQQARDFLSGRSSLIKTRLAADMQSASEALEFERAARYRDRLAALSAIQSTQDINTRSVEEADVFAIDEQAGQFCVEVFFFRSFQNWGNRAYFPKADRTLSPSEVLGSFLAQFYDDKPAPRLVLLSHPIEDAELLADALSLKSERKVVILTPKRGEKADLVAAALRNAKEALSRRLADAASQHKLLTALGHAFGMQQAPQRVEVYDNSHISGSNAVGAMIVAGPAGLMKTHYRTFNIKGADITAGDDNAMMREVLTRRFARLAKESGLLPNSPASRTPEESTTEGPSANRLEIPDQAPDLSTRIAPSPHPDTPHPGPHPASGERKSLALVDPDAFPVRPDLVLVDGGSGQLSAARAVFDELGITNVTLVGIAKGRDRDAGRETFFMSGRAPFKLPPRDPALYFVQRLRDEAHRFAIGTHRARRKRDLTRNPLDEIMGIGPSRKRALLLHFGTAKAVSRASFDDLMRTPGVNAATAKTVYDFFRG